MGFEDEATNVARNGSSGKKRSQCGCVRIAQLNLSRSDSDDVGTVRSLVSPLDQPYVTLSQLVLPCCCLELEISQRTPSLASPTWPGHNASCPLLICPASESSHSDTPSLTELMGSRAREPSRFRLWRWLSFITLLRSATLHCLPRLSFPLVWSQSYPCHAGLSSLFTSLLVSFLPVCRIGLSPSTERNCHRRHLALLNPRDSRRKRSVRGWTLNGILPCLVTLYCPFPSLSVCRPPFVFLSFFISVPGHRFFGKEWSLTSTAFCSLIYSFAHAPCSVFMPLVISLMHSLNLLSRAFLFAG